MIPGPRWTEPYKPPLPPTWMSSQPFTSSQSNPHFQNITLTHFQQINANLTQKFIIYQFEPHFSVKMTSLHNMLASFLLFLVVATTSHAKTQPSFPTNGLCFANGQTGICVPGNICTSFGITPVPNLFCPTVAPCCPGLQPPPCQGQVGGVPRNGTCVTTLTCALSQMTSVPTADCGNAPPFVQCCV